ncbi:MAG: hypothetical protein AAF565_00635 [Pseudomonadota bacterium]
MSLHPNMSAYYRSQIHRLRAMLTGESGNKEATDALRALIDHIELTPHTLPDGRRTLSASLHGSLASILSTSLEGDKALGAYGNPFVEPQASSSVVKLVAGAGFAFRDLVTCEGLLPRRFRVDAEMTRSARGNLRGPDL